MEPGVPESFNVLIRELQSLCLDVELIKTQQDVIETALAPTSPRRDEHSRVGARLHAGGVQGRTART